MRPSDEPQIRLIADLAVHLTQNRTTLTAYTGRDGYYSFDFGELLPGPAVVEATLASPYFEVIRFEDNQDVSARHRAHVVLPARHDWDWREDDSSPADVETNVFYHLNLAHRQLAQGRAATLPYRLDPLKVWVRNGKGCHAYGTDQGLHFMSGSSTCADQGLCADVIYHEFGHELVHSLLRPSSRSRLARDLEEILVDLLASALTGDPVIGEECFAGRDTALRRREF